MRLRPCAQPLDLGPRRLGVHVVDRERRDPAPVVDPRLEEPWEVVVGEVRRHLEVDVGREKLTGRPGRPEELVEGGLGVLGHLRARLGAEVLDDHLLYVAVALVERCDGSERVDALVAGLPDADQDPRRERDGQLACEADRLQARLGELVRRAEVWAAALREPQRRRLQHQSHGCGHRPEQRDVLPRHDARVDVGEEPGLREDELAHAGEVLDRRRAAELGELLARGPVAELGLVAEREEGLVAACLGARAGDAQHLVRGHVGALAPPRRVRERAVVADVPAQLRERDEDLGRVGDEAHGEARRSS